MNLGLWGSISPKTILGAIQRGSGTPPDTTRPTVEITSASSGTTAGAFDITITFSEDVTGFEVGDITVSANAGAGTLAGSGDVYTATITPTAIGVVTVDVAENVAEDAAGNLNQAATQFSITNTTVIAPAITPTLGAEALVNPGFEGTYDTEAVGIDIAPNWDMSGLDTGSDTASKEATIIHGGSASQKVICNAVNEGIISTALPLTKNKWWQLSAWVYPVSGNTRFFPGNSHSVATTTGTGAWEQITTTCRVVNGPDIAALNRSTNACTWYIDDASVKELTNYLSLLGTLAGSNYACTPTVSGTTQAGIAVAYLNATNFILAYINPANNTAYLDKCIAGVWTNVINGAVTYGAAKELRITVSGINYSLYYDSAQVGTTQAIADSLGTGVYGFSTSASNIVGTVTVNP